MLIRPRCPKCHKEGIMFDSKDPIDHFCLNPKCGEMINAKDVLQRIQDRISKAQSG